MTISMNKLVFVIFLMVSSPLASAEKEFLRPPTGELAEPASAIILKGDFRYFERLAGNSEAAKSFVRVWLTELQLVTADTIAHYTHLERADDFAFTRDLREPWGRTVVASRFERHQHYLAGGLYRMPLVLLGSVDDETESHLSDLILEHFKKSANQVAAISAAVEKSEGRPYTEDLRISTEFTSASLLLELVQPSSYGPIFPKFEDTKYTIRALRLVSKAASKGYVSRRLYKTITSRLSEVLQDLYDAPSRRLNTIYMKPEVANLIRDLARFPGAHKNLVRIAEENLIGVSCQSILSSTPTKQ